MRHSLQTAICFALTVLLSSQIAHAQVSEFSIPIHENNRETRQALEQLISVDYSETEMGNVAKDLGEKLGLQFLLHYSAEHGNLGADSLITLKLVDVRASSILNIMLDDYDCTYHIDDGIVLVISSDDIDDHMAREVFPVFDSQIKEERLMDVITYLVDPDSWEDNGGYGRIQCLDGRLIVCQSEKNIRDVRDLLIANELLMADGPD
ncbi:MAG: hypothetical protein ACR2NP_18990 [Pirellulaceae bacterium]